MKNPGKRMLWQAGAVVALVSVSARVVLHQGGWPWAPRTTAAVPWRARAQLPPWPLYRAGIALHDVFVALAEATAPPNVHVLELIYAQSSSAVVRHLVNLEIADYLDEHPGTTCEAMGRGLNFSDVGTGFACRYVHFAALRGLVKHDGDDRFSLTTRGALLSRHHPHSLRQTTLTKTDERYFRAQQAVADPSNLRSETPLAGFELAFNKTFFDFLRTQPDGSVERSSIYMHLVERGAPLACSLLWGPATFASSFRWTLLKLFFAKKNVAHRRP